jgi:iron complex outermembrane receptor protein
MSGRADDRWRRRGLGVLVLAVWVIGGGPALAEDAAPARTDERPSAAADESRVDPVEEIVVRAQRVPQRVLRVPAAVSVVDEQDIQLARQQLTLGESLSAVPGVFTQNRQNFAQDLRIAIRGFGARARFGIRGIRLIVDGIPATLPDGQGQVDTLQLATTGRIEVLRGPATSLYGSAAGGVIRVETEPVPDVPVAQARAAVGRYGYRSYDAKGLGRSGPVGWLVGLSRQETGGYRRQSRMESNLLNSRVSWAIDDASELTAYLHFLYGPVAEDPGGLTAAQVAADRRQAQTCNAILDAGEQVDQVGGALKYRHAFGARNETTAVGWWGWRDFANRLAFGNACLGGGAGGSAGFLDRFFAGGSLQHVYTGDLLSLPNRLLVGVEVEAQRDDRRARQLFPTSLGATTLDQAEDVTAIRLFVQDDWTLPADLELGFSLGFDALRYQVTDHLPPSPGDADDSGRLDFDAWSPAATLRWSPALAANPYLRVSTSFEPPTTTELRRPDGTGGFDATLEPQRAVNFEAGIKGLLTGLLRYELAVYHVRIDDEILRIQIAGDDRFRNAGRTTRTGVEAALSWRPLPPVTTTVAYTYSASEFLDHLSLDAQSDFSGNQVPGVPEHTLYAALELDHDSGLFASVEGRYVGAFFADDANQVRTDSFGVVDLRAGWRLERGRLRVTPQIGVNNLLDADYIDNVRTDEQADASSRIFEPAPGIEVYGGLSVAVTLGGAP